MNESPTPTKAGTTPTQPTLRSDGLAAPDPQSSTTEALRPSDRRTGPERGKHA